jgi:hypothetical protein
LLATTLVAIGCKKTLDAKLTVMHQESLRLEAQTKSGETLRFPEAQMRAELEVDSKAGSTSYLRPFLLKNGKSYRPEIPLKLPAYEDLLASTDPVRLDADKIGQNFGLMLMREIRPGKDLYTVTFHNKDFDTTLGKMTFEFESDKAAYDEKNMKFLASYQKVKRKHRAAVFKINGDVDDMMSLGKDFGWLEKALDHVVNYGGAILISPWVYARYSSVKWLIGDVSSQKTQEQWNEAAAGYPVIDYFSYVHSGDQYDSEMDSAGLKKNQLRLAYTSACSSGSAKRFIIDYGAANAGGHRNTSASPFFQFNVVKKWIYGYTFEDSMVKAWESGLRKIKALEWISFAPLWQKKHGFMYWSNADDMAMDSELMLSYTPEVPANTLTIKDSAVLKGTPGQDLEIKEERVTHILAKRRGEAIIEN